VREKTSRQMSHPQDVMFPTLIEQVSHTTRIYEMVLGRALSGGLRKNLADKIGGLCSCNPLDDGDNSRT